MIEASIPALLLLLIIALVPTAALSAADCSTCDHSLTAPLYYGCSNDSAYVTFDDIQIDCGAALSLNQTESTPKFYYPDAEKDALYTLLLIDTTGIDPIVGTQPPFLPFPIIHYGAMNIPGDVLIDGMSMGKFHYDSTGVRVQPFVEYQKPIPSEELSKVSQPGMETPDLNTRAFNYEFMLGKQSYEKTDPLMDLYTNWEFVGFMKRNVDVLNIVSTFISTGYCVKDIEEGAFGSDCPVPAETGSGYGSVPAHVADPSGGSFDFAEDGDFLFTFPPNSSSSPTSTPVCVEENDALNDCFTSDEDPFGFGGMGCSFCETTAQLQNFMDFLTCDDKKENGYCGAYASCVKEQCNTDCMDQAFDLMHCNHLNDEYDVCDLQCSPDDATNFTTPAPQTHAECIFQSVFVDAFGAFGGIFDDPTAAANFTADTDPAVACCTEFPDDPMCAYLECFDESTGILTCDCSVISELFADITASPFGRAMEAQGEGTRRKLAAALPSTHRKLAVADCCKEGMSKDVFQGCMDDVGGGDMMGIGFSQGDDSFSNTFPPASAPVDVCPEENEALTNCIITADDSFGFESFGCLSCQYTAQLQDIFGFSTCDGKKENSYCIAYANCVKEQCNADCMDQTFEVLHCNLKSEDGCDLQCSLDDATNTTSNTTAPQSFEECYTESLFGGFFFDEPDTDTNPATACCVDFPDAPQCSPQSFDDCILQSAFGMMVGDDDPAANSIDFDPNLACCVDFEHPMCALNECIDENEMIICECSVVVSRLLDLEATQFAEVFEEVEGMSMSTAAAECCQEGMSTNIEFQACMDEFGEDIEEGDAYIGGDSTLLTATSSTMAAEVPITNPESTSASAENNSTTGGDSATTATSSTEISSATDATEEAPIANTEATTTQTDATPIDGNSTTSTGAPPTVTTTEAPKTDLITSAASNTKDMAAVFISAIVVGGMQML
eukprot:CAMPEP_0172302440 /NCGR_PEP_ID=MMETSP1058-20130122/4134_1 /TAXON_ID=83371 /ORGANISM="Detonula confervacea, Strain CCMP 353" /LENGTH=950 /DNA_ID=CAMNT_0013012913 /DNA_START=91 /DNA_END=2943 /DNA_ORIENTATION=-